MDTRTSRGEARHRFRHAGRSVILLLTATAGCSQLGSWRDASGHARGGRVSPPARTQRPGKPRRGGMSVPGLLTSRNTVRCAGGPYGWRYTRSRFAEGGCSGPRQDVGPFWDFRIARQAHDYGYDLVRFGVASRRHADALLCHDMMSSCGLRAPIPGGAPVADSTHSVLEIGDVPPEFEPHPIPTT